VGYGCRRRFYRYPHRQYYYIHGYRGAYRGGGIGGFLIALGVVLLLIGVVISIVSGIFIFNGVFFIGAAVTGLGILLAIILMSRSSFMRNCYGDGRQYGYSDSNYNNQYNNQQ